MKLNAINAIDFYKSGHRVQYPKGTEYVYSNFTPRTGKHCNINGSKGVINFGLQGFIKWFLKDLWDETFFNQPLDDVRAKYQRRLDNALGKDAVICDHIEALHNLGYLPIEIKSLPEGSFVPYGVPAFTIVNTRPEFFWLTNYLESVMSAELWRGFTSATTAFAYRQRFMDHSKVTGSPAEFIDWQGHDFSFRGMGGVYDSMTSGAGHLTSFTGTDSIPAIDYLENYYCADSDKEMVGGSVPATEHSVMCMGTLEDEFETFKRLVTETYPGGIISIVSDTWDLWKVLTDYLPRLKDEIMARDGRVVIRPDSGDPVDIICGETLMFGEGTSPSDKGVYELLWDTFGGTINEQGYKVLDTHVGAIYGDSITLERQEEILERLEGKGFCASNLVLGIGSFTYAYVTRDTHGFAMKATYGVVDGEGREIFKDPITDDGMKKSAKGMLLVEKVDGEYTLIDQVTVEEADGGELETVFRNGQLVKETTLSEIRERINTLLA